MDVRILGWRYQNIRGMRDVTIDLGDQPPRWTLIQMPNGTGKTTTLTLMRVALSDEELSVPNIRSFRPDDQTDAGEFQLRLSVDGERCWLFVKFDYDTGTLRRFTSRAATDAGGLETGRRLKGNLQDLLTPAFTRLFIFDGELAKSIRDLGKDEAARAIHTLYRLDRVDHWGRAACASV
jgi:DNA sulfur modification protein DndD